VKAYQKIKILRIKNSKYLDSEDFIATERKLRILINGIERLKLYCSPIMVRELVVGFIMTEGIIKGKWCIERINIQYNNNDIIVNIPVEGEVVIDTGVITSGCIGGITFEKVNNDLQLQDSFTIDIEKLFKLFNDFQRKSELYRLTGCLHSAALSDGESIIVFAEDIGRHNAIDKVIGYSLLEGITFEDKIMFVSGRLSSEIALKCSKWAIPIVISRTAPTTKAIDIAYKRGITLIGFMRGQRFNLYTHPHRIIFG